MIGIFDSGQGGRPIAQAIQKLLPQEKLFYYADTAHAPYGDKTEKQIGQFTLTALKKMEKIGCRMIVIACNTATTAGLDYYRQHIKIPLIGVVPVIKTAAQLTKSKKIALLATSKTATSPYTDNLIKKFAPDCQIKKIVCTGWVEAIENQTINDRLLKKYMDKITKEDVAILGCTHYTLIKDDIKRLFGPDIKVKVIDSTAAVARHALRVWQTIN